MILGDSKAFGDSHTVSFSKKQVHHLCEVLGLEFQLSAE